MIRRYSHIFGASLVAIVSLTLYSAPVVADDELDCIMCHKYRGLSRIDEDGEFRLFYINQELFNSGPHRRNQCKDCHNDIDRIPHKPAVKVDCAQQCHIVEPSGEKRFTHESIAETLARSAHGKLDAEGNPKPFQEDYPDCKDCHDQPFYRPVSVDKGTIHPGVSERAVTRCKSCHKNGDFAEDFYEHVTSRLRKTRFPMETIENCAKCHQDPEFRERHELDDVVTSYKQTFHGKLIALGSEKTADCLDCHVVAGENTHLIESQSEPASAVYKTNVPATCGTEGCHTQAGPYLAGFQTHVTYDREKYPMQFYMLIFFKGLIAVVLYFFLALIFFELLRRLFPNFTFIREKR